jgi:hypothetical protein
VPAAGRCQQVPLLQAQAGANAAAGRAAGQTPTAISFPAPACSITSNPTATKGGALIQKFIDNMPRNCSDTANKACSK